MKYRLVLAPPPKLGVQCEAETKCVPIDRSRAFALQSPLTLRLQSMHFVKAIIASFFVIASMVVVETALGQAVVQEDTLVLMNFDGSVQPEFAKGTGTVSLRGGTIVPHGGRFGGGLSLPQGALLELVGDDGNLNPSEGTIAFWIKPAWPGSDEAKHSLFGARVAEQEYLNINTLGKGRLGIAMAAGMGDDFRWRRADGDAAAWDAESWHHVAFTWGDGTLAVFLDGQQDADAVSDSHMLRQLPQKLTLFGSDAVVDDLHIHNRRFTAEDVQRAIEIALDPPARMLDTLHYQASGDVERGGMTILGDVVLPLALGTETYSRGFAMGSGGALTFSHNGSRKWLCATVGVSLFAPAGTTAQFTVWGDDERIFTSDILSVDNGPLPIRIDLATRRVIRLTVEGTEMRNRDAVWACPCLVDTNEDTPFSSSQALTETKRTMYQRQLQADDYGCEIATEQPWVVCRKHWADDIDITIPPQPLSADAALTFAASPGEYEPVNFTVYAINTTVDDARVSISDLKCGKETLPARACDIRLVLRRLMRDLYTLPPERSTVVSRFLLPNAPVDIPKGTFREYHVIVHVPRDQPSGEYRGTVTIAPATGDARRIPLRAHVRPMELGPPGPNAYGVYFRFPSDDEGGSGLQRELVDIREHGGSMLKTDLGVEYVLGEHGIVATVARLRCGLERLAKLGYEGPMPVSTRAETAARLLKYDPVADYEDVEARKAFFATVAEGMHALDQLNAEFPQFELLATHMDEVFGRERLPRFLRLTEAVRQASKRRVYITIHNDPKRDVSAMMEQIDPFADVRCFNGHAMDNWIRAGNTFDDLKEQLADSGDEAWLYHNIRGSFFPAEWTRLVNGFYLWTSPIKIHVPWMYYHYNGNPMDCTDGPTLRGGDFAYAVPDPDDPDAMIPTRHWEAFREGTDDMRYLRTLERLLGARGETRKAVQAKRWLAELRERLMPSPDKLQRIETESPLLTYLADEFDGDDYLLFREEVAEWIAELQRE